MFGSILVIFKSEEWRDFFYEIFTNANYNVTTFPFLKEVPLFFKNERPDYIICGIDAHQDIGLLSNIKQIDKNINIIILAGKSFGEELQNQYSYDKRVYLLKEDAKKLELVQAVFDILKREDTHIDIDKKASFEDEVLVVDDEQEANSLIRSYLERRGYNVKSAFNGEEALLKIKLHRPGVVILDVCMHGIDGILILKHIKEINKSTVVIMTSGISDESIVNEAVRLGASGYLIKPFNLSTLEAAILAHTLLGKRVNGK